MDAATSKICEVLGAYIEYGFSPTCAIWFSMFSVVCVNASVFERAWGTYRITCSTIDCKVAWLIRNYLVFSGIPLVNFYGVLFWIWNDLRYVVCCGSNGSYTLERAQGCRGKRELSVKRTALAPLPRSEGGRAGEKASAGS